MMSQVEKTMEYLGAVRPDILELTSPVSDRSVSPLQAPGTGTFPHFIFAPIHYEAAYAYPLIVWLHGSGSDENQLFRVMPKISMRNYVAVAPRGLTYPESNSFRALREIDSPAGRKQIASTFDWPESTRALDEAQTRIFESIERTKQRYNVNNRRIFLVGFDVGGTLALRIAMRFPGSFAGAVSLCGQFPQGNFPLCHWNDIRDFPIMLSIGAKSSVYSGDKVAKELRLFHAAGMSVSVRQYQAGQELTPKMLADVNRWIMER